MGIVTDYIRHVIAKQVDDHGLVLWFDPERHYSELAGNLGMTDTTVAHYEGSFFALRHEVEPLLEGLEPPRLVVYVPLDPVKTHDALIELEAAGIIMKPGQQPPSRNTRLSIIARNALNPILGEGTVASIEKQVEAGKLTLAELDALAERSEGITQGVVSVIFGTGNPTDVALAFLFSDRYDGDIESKGASQELALLLGPALGVELPGGESADDLRAHLARHILATDLVASLRGELPAALSTVEVASKPATREACVNLARTWRLRYDFRQSYQPHARRVEKELGLARIEFARDQIACTETFLGVEQTLQRNVEAGLLGEATDELIEIAQQRQSSFWSEVLPAVQARWALVATAGQVLRQADRVSEALKPDPGDVRALFTSYADSESPWCLLDTCQRHMERRIHNFDFDLSGQDQSLDQLIAKARNRYMEVGSALAEAFLQRYQEAKFKIPGVLRQADIFHRKVKPALERGKTAYVWVDALRFEMGRELVESLTDEFGVELQPAVATVPTITEIGMAALLPRAEEAITIVAAGDSKLALEVDGKLMRDRKDRVNFLKANAGVTVFDARLDDFIPKPKKRVRAGVRDADLILVTSQEIDALCEGDNVLLARQTMDRVLHNLRRAFRILAELGVETIIFTADHGYLFGDELGSDMKIDAPGGETADLHRRVWVGRGGTADPAYLRARLADFGLGGELEIATPWNFACFKVQGGAKAYFHGGLSLPELAIPVATLTPKKKEAAVPASEVMWALIPGSQKISTRFFSVQITGQSTSLFELTPPRVRVEIRAKGDTMSMPISASYGFEEATGDIQLKLSPADRRSVEPNTVTLMIIKEPSQKTVTIHLLDATSGTELARLGKIEMAIAL